MTMNDDADITLWLHDIRDLFVEPDYDPFDEHAIERPGLEVIANFVEARSLVRRVQGSLFVPPDQSGGGTWPTPNARSHLGRLSSQLRCGGSRRDAQHGRRRSGCSPRRSVSVPPSCVGPLPSRSLG